MPPSPQDALKEYEARWPFIPWREPIKVTVANVGWGMCCRVCIALDGLKGEDMAVRSFTAEEFERHLKEAHDAV